MKIVLSHVTNSSSSSFIVINKSDKLFEFSRQYLDAKTIINNCFSKGEFGWEEHEYHSFYDKFIFAWLQARYMQEVDLIKWNKKLSVETGNKWMTMLVTLLKEKNIAFNEYLWEELENLYNNSDIYVDHQSASYEFSNTEMFDNIGCLDDFLFSEQSYIRTKNDNSDYYD